MQKTKFLKTSSDIYLQLKNLIEVKIYIKLIDRSLNALFYL